MREILRVNDKSATYPLPLSKPCGHECDIHERGCVCPCWIDSEVAPREGNRMSYQEAMYDARYNQAFRIRHSINWPEYVQ